MGEFFWTEISIREECVDHAKSNESLKCSELPTTGAPVLEFQLTLTNLIVVVDFATVFVVERNHMRAGDWHQVLRGSTIRIIAVSGFLVWRSSSRCATAANVKFRHNNTFLAFSFIPSNSSNCHIGFCGRQYAVVAAMGIISFEENFFGNSLCAVLT